MLPSQQSEASFTLCIPVLFLKIKTNDFRFGKRIHTYRFTTIKALGRLKMKSPVDSPKYA